MDPTSRRLAALVVLGLGAFFSPLLGIFNRPGRVLGLPLLPAYLFAVWTILVVAAWWLTRRGPR
ncbi:MAG: hypothetical protein HY900_17440 [Deltaproteobacteria bacterium]|nr:hypothetical protein [Deltaproteobacteria bacterium]